jgi:hypothetical protein
LHSEFTHTKHKTHNFDFYHRDGMALFVPAVLASLLVLALVVVALLDAIASVVVVVLFYLSVCYFALILLPIVALLDDIASVVVVVLLLLSNSL